MRNILEISLRQDQWIDALGEGGGCLRTALSRFTFRPRVTKMSKLLFITLLSPRRTCGRGKVHCDDLIQVHWLSVTHVINGQSQK